MKKTHCKKSFVIWTIVIAILACALFFLHRLDYLPYQNSTYAGTFVDGSYYYQVPHRGVYRYEPTRGAECVLHTIFEDSWAVNEKGLYYVQDRKLYFREHENGKTVKLYDAFWKIGCELRLELEPDQKVYLSLYSYFEKKTTEQILIDGISGTVLAQEGAIEREDPSTVAYSLRPYQVGDRRIEIKPIQVEVSSSERDVQDGHRLEWYYELLEHGRSLLPENMALRYPPRVCGENLYVAYVDLTLPLHQQEQKVHAMLLRADGTAILLEDLPGFVLGGTDRYLFVRTVNGGTVNYEIESGETIELGQSFMGIATDGHWLYAYAMQCAEQACYRLIYDETGKMRGCELVTDHITDAEAIPDAEDPYNIITPDQVTAKVADVTATSATFTIANKSGAVLHGSEYYYIQREEDGVWKNLTEKKEAAFRDIACEIQEQYEQQFDWAERYQTLTAGKYRLLYPCHTGAAVDTTQKTDCLAVEFSIQ